MAKTPADTARKIWLAGIGAYGKAFTDAQESLAKVTGDTSKAFEELVAKGEEIEDTVEARGRELAKRVTAPSFSIDERIKEMRARLKLGGDDDGDNDERLDAIEARLDAIDEKLDMLLAQAKKKKPAKKQTD